MNTRNFLKFDLGKLNPDKIVEVTLRGDAANVRLLNESNMYNYEHVREYRGFGGLATKSPFEIKIPSHDHWFIVVDMKGLVGTPNASVKVR